MKITFTMIVFQSDYFLEPCLRSIIPYGKVVVVEGPVRTWRDKGFATSTDRTNEILHRLLPSGCIKHGKFEEKEEEQHATESMIPDDTDFVWHVDSDEIYSQETIERMMGLLETDKWDSVGFRPYSFYGGFDRYMTGFEENYEGRRIQRWYPGAKWHAHRGLSVLAPDGKPWHEHRHMGMIESGPLVGRMFHYSYVMPKQMRDKAYYYSIIGAGYRIPDYFKRVYLPWVMGDEKAKRAIEDEYNGVHDYIPEVRGACRTVPYLYGHPKEIEDTIDVLQEEFNRELDECLAG